MRIKQTKNVGDIFPLMTSNRLLKKTINAIHAGSIQINVVIASRIRLSPVLLFSQCLALSTCFSLSFKNIDIQFLIYISFRKSIDNINRWDKLWGKV